MVGWFLSKGGPAFRNGFVQNMIPIVTRLRNGGGRSGVALKSTDEASRVNLRVIFLCVCDCRMYGEHAALPAFNEEDVIHGPSSPCLECLCHAASTVLDKTQ